MTSIAVLNRPWPQAGRGRRGMSVRYILCWVGNVRLAHDLLLQSFGPPLLTYMAPSSPGGTHAQAPGQNYQSSQSIGSQSIPRCSPIPSACHGHYW